MNIMNKIKYIIYTLLFVVGSISISCEKDDEPSAANSRVDGIYSDDDEVGVNSGYPGASVIAKGVNMGDIASIIFDNKSEVIFNPVLNSESAIIFTVPFDETMGSKFGNQEIKFTKKDGSSFTTQFNILQPLPQILSNDGFVPERPTVGTSVTVHGQGFYDVEGVTFDGENVDFTEISSTELSFIVPEDATSGGDVIIETVAGVMEEPSFMDIYLGYDVYLITDFDGEGFIPENTDWTSYGDAASYIFSDVDGIRGNYAELNWEGATTNGYNGSQSTVVPMLDEVNETDPYKVGFSIDVSGIPGTIVDIYLDDGEVNWAYTFTIEGDGWQTIEGIVAEFGYNYNSGDQDNGNANPATVNRIKVAINQGAGTPNPSRVRYDNVKWNVYESAQEANEGIVNLVLNGGLEEGDGDDFTNWGKWNGADRMTAETSDVRGGARALRVVNSAAGNPWEAQFVSDEMPTEIGVEYTASMWIKGDADGGVVRFSTNETTAQYGPDATVTTDWQQVSWTFTATADNTRLVLDMGQSAATYIIDDILLVAN